MKAALKPYPSYVDSGVTWFPRVPSHWEVRRCRFLFREVDQRSRDGSETHLSMSQQLGLVPSSMVKKRTLVSESYEGGKLCQKDDLVLNRLKAHLGVFARAAQDGVVSPDYTVLRPMRSANVRYFEATLRSPACRSELRIRAKGIVEGFWRLYTDDLYNIALPTPPAEDQAVIVRYLDYMDRRIRRYIRAKQKLIKLLEEQKQAIIHQAITGQIDVRTGKPYPAYKDSGVKWLGRIPEHWSLPPNGSLLRRRKVLVGERHTEYQLLSLTKDGVIVRDVESGKGKFSADMGTCQQVRAGDLIFCLFDVPETPRTVGLSQHNGMITGAYTLFGCDDAVLSEFLELFYRAMDDRKLLSPLYSGLRNTIPPTRFLRTKTPVPTCDEQAAIVQYLDDTMASADEAIACTRREIDLIREYRTRLIADVVTDRLDVREVAANLPDEGGEAEALVDEDLMTDDSGGDETAEEEAVLEEADV